MAIYQEHAGDYDSDDTDADDDVLMCALAPRVALKLGTGAHVRT